MPKENIPTSPRPLFIKEADGNTARCRLVEIEHVTQPGTRKNNAIHVELFDRLEIGRLDRTSDDMPLDGDSIKETVDDGVFLCGRSGKGIKVFQTDKAETIPTCKKCLEIAARLLEKGLTLYVVSKDGWDKLQQAKVESQFGNFIANLKKLDEEDFITFQSAVETCQNENALIDFENKNVQIEFRKSNKVFKGNTFKEVITKFIKDN